jgi:hypothetical protein
VETARAADLFEFAAQFGHAIADQASIGFDLRFARSAQKAKPTALALKVSPAADESTGLIVEVCQFDLQSALCRHGALAENFEDQPCPVDHFALELFFEIALLDRGQAAIDDDQTGIVLIARGSDIRDLAFAEQRCRPRFADWDGKRVDHHQPDGKGQPARFFQPCGGVARCAPPTELRIDDQRARAARDVAGGVVPEVQLCSPSSLSPIRSTGVSGWMVETACLYANWT